MPVQEIRESIELPSVVLEDRGVNIVQRQINMRENVQHNLVNCDMFFDNVLITQDDEPWQGVVEIFVSPRPIIYTNNSIAGFASRGPSASNDMILFKAIVNGGDFTFNALVGQEFPNVFSGYKQSFDFYHPTLYITFLFHTTVDVVLKDFACSFLFEVNHKKIPLLTSTLGKIKENSDLNVMALSSMGRVIQRGDNVGQISPWWKWGGVRPELMLKSDAFAEFFYTTDTQEGEKTVDPTNLRIFAGLARQMVRTPDALGTPNTVKGSIPDWISTLMPDGITSGPVRDQWPPLKYADNGNVLTF
tara:strand:+ start:1241 stop:2149 length:909 start_codon:yes stop_codon:yes gene_type:complete